MISKIQIFAVSFAVAGWLAWGTQLILGKRKRVCWAIVILLLALAITIPHVLMQMKIWNRHGGLAPTPVGGTAVTHAHTFDDAQGHIH